jgi:hypothetical protein
VAGHANVGGLDVSIENPAESRRRPEWPVLQSHYGYVRGVPARSPDKEHVDVFVKPGTTEDYNGPVFGFLAGSIIDRFGVRRLMLAGIVIAGLALIGLASVTTLWLVL